MADVAAIRLHILIRAAKMQEVFGCLCVWAAIIWMWERTKWNKQVTLSVSPLTCLRTSRRHTHQTQQVCEYIWNHLKIVWKRKQCWHLLNKQCPSQILSLDRRSILSPHLKAILIGRDRLNEMDSDLLKASYVKHLSGLSNQFMLQQSKHNM